MGGGAGNPFTPGEGNPFTPDAGADGGGPMAGGEPSPSAVPMSTPSVPETTKPRQMPGGNSGGGMDMGMGGDTGGGMGGDSNVPQDSPPPMDKAATLRRITADILVTNPTVSTRQAQMLAQEVVRRYPKVASPQNPWGLPDNHPLMDPAHPLHNPNHPLFQQLQQQVPRGPGGRQLQTNPNSQYPFIEDAANRAAEWATNKVKQRRQRNTAQPDPTPDAAAKPDVPSVAPAAQGVWGTPAPSPAPGSVQTPEPNGWKPAPLPAPAAQPQPSRAQQLRNRVLPRGRHSASLVYGSEG